MRWIFVVAQVSALPRARWRKRGRDIVARRDRRKPAPIGLIAAAGTTTIIALFGLMLFVTSRPLRDLAAGRDVAPAGGARPASASALARYAGHWVSGNGKGFVIGKSGTVWLDAGGLLGRLHQEVGSEAEVAVQGDGFQCSYKITFENADRSTWVLTDRSPLTPCPQGTLNRPYTY